MTRTRLILIVVTGALLALATACGAALDSDDGGDGSGPGSNGDPQSINETYGGSEALSSGDGEFAIDNDDASRASSLEPGLPPTDPAQAQQFQNLLDRRIIQSTSIDVESEEVSRHFQDIIRFADVAGGFVASSSFTNLEDGQSADLTIRVPGTSYQSVLADIRGLAVVTTESSDSNDVTEEYTDLQARLRTLSATEQRYLELLVQADDIPAILAVQDRLDAVRGQIEQAQGRINLLEHLTDLATITVHLRPPSEAVVATVEAGGGGLDPLDSAAAAWDTSLEALRNVAAVALVIVVFSWWIVPPLAVVALGARWWSGRRPRSTAIDPKVS